MRRSLIAAVCITLLFAGWQRLAAAADVKKITSVEGITEYRLDNGMKVLLFPDASKPQVTVNLTIFVGSRHEGYGESGMAHLLEHMLFKGTPTHKNIPKVLQDRGASFNGTTWLDRTNYFETLPAEGDNLEFAIRLEADRMMNSSILASELAKEFSVVRNEFERGENSPRNILDQRMTAVAYEWHNYGKSTIGNRADIERVPIDSLRAFYRKYYQPDNAMVIVSGKFEDAKVLALVTKHFGAIPRPKRKLPKTYTEEPPQDGERLATLRRVGDVAVVGALYHICSGPHPDYAPLAVLEDVFTSQPSGRLYTALVKSRRAANVNGSIYPLHDPGMVQFMATVSKGNDPQLLVGTMLDTIDKAVREGVTKEEVERSKRRLLKQWELASTDSRRIAIQLSEWAAQGDWRLYFLYRDRLEKVAQDDVDRVAKKYLRKTNRTVGMFIPTKKPEQTEIPQTPAIAKIIGDYKGRKSAASGEAFDVSPRNIEDRTKRLTLANGAKAALLVKKTRGEIVSLQMSLRFGSAGNLKGLDTASDFVGSLLTKGTKKYTRQQLQDELDKHQIRLSVGSSAGSVTVQLQTKRASMPPALKLLREVLRNPTLPEAEFEILRRAQLATTQQQLTNPQMLAVNLVQRQLSRGYEKDDPRYYPTIPENVKRLQGVKLEDVRKLYREYLGGRHALITVVGDFDPKLVVSSLEETLSGWEAKQKYERLVRKGDSGEKGIREDINTPGKANAVYFAAMAFPLRDDDPDYAPLTLGNFILGGGSLASRLGTRVRQKEGLSYGVGSQLQASSLDRRGVFYVYAISNPKNTAKVKSTIQEELEKILKEGITDTELAAAKAGYLRQRKLARSSDQGLAGQLQASLTAGRTMAYHSKLEQQIGGVTREQIVAALRKYIRLGRLHVVAAGDFGMKSGKRKAEGGR